MGLFFDLQVSEELLWELFVQAGPVGKFGFLSCVDEMLVCTESNRL